MILGALVSNDISKRGFFFFIFFEIFIFWAVSSVKQQKIAKNEK